MTKMLKMSFVGLLVALPLAANATTPTAKMTKKTIPEPVPGATPVVASQTYVQGAYNSVADTVNSVIDDLAVTNSAIGIISSGNTVGENLEALESAINTAAGDVSDMVTKTSAAATLASGASTLHYVSSNGALVGQNLGNLDAQVYDNATTIGEMQSQTIKVVTEWGDETNPTNLSLFPND